MARERRAKGTGSIFKKYNRWIAIAPQLGGRKSKAKQQRIASCETEWAAESALDAWLNMKGRILRKAT